MSQLNRLIEKHTTSVEFKTLGDVAYIASARAKLSELDSTTYVGVDNLLSDFGGRKDSDYVGNSSSAIRFHSGDVLVGNIRPYLKKVWLADREGGASPDVLTVSLLPQGREAMLPQFLYYLLASEAFIRYSMQHAKGAKMPRGDKKAILKYRIPVPPLNVQREIARVLDHFTELAVELEEKLEQELAARYNQYAHYRESLLSFAAAEDVPWREMGEIGHFLRGRRFTKQDYVQEGGIPVIHYGEIYTHFGTTAHSARSYVRTDLAPNLRFACPGDVILTDVGETVDDVGKAVAWLGSSDVAIHDHCYAFRHPLNPAFVAYYMQTNRFRVEKAKYVARTKVKTLLMNGLAKVSLPVPPPAEQARLVSILDKFNALVTDSSASLDAEISARRAQYKHYRDQLMTFPEAPD